MEYDLLRRFFSASIFWTRMFVLISVRLLSWRKFVTGAWLWFPGWVRSLR